MSLVFYNSILISMQIGLFCLFCFGNDHDEKQEEKSMFRVSGVVVGRILQWVNIFLG